jgi:HlyD family secretion protein
MKALLPREQAEGVDALLGLKPSSGPFPGVAPAGRWKAWLIAVALAAALAGTLYALFGPTSGAIRYVTEPVTRGDLHVIVTATGSVQPTSQVEVSSELSGTVSGTRHKPARSRIFHLLRRPSVFA